MKRLFRYKDGRSDSVRNQNRAYSMRTNKIFILPFKDVAQAKDLYEELV